MEIGTILLMMLALLTFGHFLMFILALSIFRTQGIILDELKHLKGE